MFVDVVSDTLGYVGPAGFYFIIMMACTLVLALLNCMDCCKPPSGQGNCFSPGGEREAASACALPRVPRAQAAAIAARAAALAAWRKWSGDAMARATCWVPARTASSECAAPQGMSAAAAAKKSLAFVLREVVPPLHWPPDQPQHETPQEGSRRRRLAAQHQQAANNRVGSTSPQTASRRHGAVHPSVRTTGRVRDQWSSRALRQRRSAHNKNTSEHQPLRPPNAHFEQSERLCIAL